ncbi:DMP19 family protein [Marinifilum sp. RC60d5]|uniref:DMP19 family protein n=1 Tax=Marinifilum sp. RC60d5 TaxID=3458414 RepID=UPI004035F61D
MNKEKLIEKKFNESVQGIDEKILSNQEDWYTYVHNLPIHLRVVYTIVVLHQQVFNGGFHQYFLNGYGLFGYLTLDSLKIINANFTMNLLNTVLKEVNIEGFNVEEFRHKVFNKEIGKIANFDDKLSDFLEKCDDTYYEVEEDLTNLLGQYLESVS